MSDDFRILVTGSRQWMDSGVLASAICAAVPDRLITQADHGPRLDWSRVVIVHGACPRGADYLASRLARRWTMREEAHPADWAGYGRAAGPLRNQAMVDAGADICLAFPLGASVGTRDCMRRAEAAGIPVRIYTAGAA